MHGVNETNNRLRYPLSSLLAARPRPPSAIKPITMASTETNNRPRSRLRYAILGIAFCAISYTIIWDDEIATGEGGLRHEHRQLAFLDNSPPPKYTGIYNSSPQFTALVQPSNIISTVHRRVPAYDESDANDSSCDDVLLFMPESFAHNGHGSQLNSYILAAMMATYTNKAMIILEPPHERKEFKGDSQFGCPKETWMYNEEGKKLSWDLTFPRGLSRLVKHSDSLSSKCYPPCQGRFKYEDWDTIRKSRKDSVYYPRVYSPQEVKCINHNGRQTKVLVVGAGETRDYFEGHFQEKMVQRPSTDAYSWAQRLGAKPREAKVFAGLEDEKEIWDYISAFMAQSGMLRFQPWIARDVEEYIRQSGLPLDASYDAIHIRRGDMLAKEDDASPKQFLREYWESRDKHFNVLRALLHPDVKQAPHNYVPFTHYLSQFDDLECNTENARVVYVATDDPAEVQREIGDLPKDEDGNSIIKDGCHKIKFFFTPTKEIENFHIDDGPDQDDCGGRYKRNIASIADMMIAAKSDMFVGEFNSNWGRLVRIFRMQLKNVGDSDINESPVAAVERKMNVAWGDEYPLPPGM
mmetsp:Transcript_16823/g.36316  ORF Transcript_16823/g.36316 Transcript_16823/m.36316 type:complete len:579 (-) Transcript_16823:79-1815(-)